LLLLCFMNGYRALSQCSPGSTIRVGTTCTCNSCTDVTVMSLESYTGTGLNDEWIPSWHTESLKAGAIAYRSYGAYHIDNPYNGTYDLANTTCKQVWSASSSAACISAAAATAGQVLTVGTGGPIARSEYSAETNNQGCGDGFTGCSSCSSSPWPCISDPVCAGKAPAGHWRGMCQWGSQRWAQDGQTYTWIINHYYNPAGIYLCAGTPGCTPATGNDYCFGPPAPQVLTVTGGCASVNGTTCGATPSVTSGSGCSSSHTNGNVPDVWYSFTATAPGQTIVVNSGANFDAVVELYGTACGSLLLPCANATGTGGQESLTWTSAVPGNTYFIRVYDYNENANVAMTGGTTFNICVSTSPWAGIDIVDSQTETLTVYPNPASDNFDIHCINNIAAVKVISITGIELPCTLHRLSEKHVRVATVNTPVGIYLLEVTSDDGNIYYKKLLIAH